MELKELRTILEKYTDIELYNKMKYEKSHYGASYNYAWEIQKIDAPLIAPAPKSIQQFFIVTGLTDVFPEQQYFTEDYDVTLLKHDRYAFPFVHKHNFFEIVYCVSGVFDHEFEGNKRTHKAGEICFISPGVQHALHVFSDSIVLNILIKRSNFDQLFRPLIGKSDILSDFFTSSLYGKDQKMVLFFDTKEDEYIRDRVLNMLKEKYEELPFCSEVISHETLLLFYDLLRRYSSTTTKLVFEKEVNDKFTQVIEYIHDHFATVTLDDLSKEFYFNKAYLSRMIKEKTGTNFSDLVKTIRLNIAEQLLTNTTLSLLEISQAIGYTDSSHLFRLFKQQYGLNPKEYRKQFQNPKLNKAST